MPRIKQYDSQYRDKDFRRHVRVRMAAMEMPQYELAEYLGVTDSRTSQILDNPGRIPVDRLRKMIEFLRIEPAEVLRLLGYSEKQIKEVLPQSKAVE